MEFFKSVLSTKIQEIYLAISLILIIYFMCRFLSNSNKKYPPGPIGFPIVGYLPLIRKDPHLKFTEIAKTYGEVFSIRLGSQLVVVLNGADSIKEALGKHEFLGKPPNNECSLLTQKSSFFSPNIKVWQEHRGFMVRTLKDVGLRRSKIEVLIQEEINHLLKYLKNCNGKPVDFLVPLIPSISNNMGLLLYGQRYDYKHPIRKILDKTNEEVSKMVTLTDAYVYFPWLKNVPFHRWLFNIDKVLKAIETTDNFFEKKVEEHKKTLDSKNTRDFIDSYLVEMKLRRKQNPDTTFTDKTLSGNISNLFGAGSDSIRTVLSWCVYVMAAYQDVQMKCRKEIVDVLGTVKKPEMQLLKLMPYTHAVILEVLRWKTIFPLSFLRYTLAESTVKDFVIPKHTIVLANFWAVHHNRDYWNNPHDFIPERFLKEDNKLIKNPIYYMPFSVGRRTCPGEEIAYIEIFFYLVSMLQNFYIQFPEGTQLNFEAELNISYRPKPFEICFVPKIKNM